jgi:phospho-N-acetylmuramoyl-pentapeptide-transferase
MFSLLEPLLSLAPSPLWIGLGAFLTSSLCVALTMPLWIRWCLQQRAFQPIRSAQVSELGGLHQHKARTPTMGGLILLGSAILSASVFAAPSHLDWWTLGLPGLAMGVMGAWDDGMKIVHGRYDGMSPRMKLICQALTGIALGLMVLGAAGDQTELQRLYVPLLGPLEFSSWIAWSGLLVFSALVFAGGTNAVNLTDGMDGLASGLLTLAFLFFGGLALFQADWIDPVTRQIVWVWSMSCAGACLAFLGFNRHPARVFMGDTGSMGFGALLCSMAILLRSELLLAICGGCFVLETLSVVLQVWSFRARGRRIFRCAPLHHHFEMGGIPETRVVAGFWIAGLLLALVAWQAV